MNEPPRPQSNPNSPPTAATKEPVPSEAGKADARATAKALTPEEQMALYEKDLKENDWGHQPC